jgi:hypothetical protein
LKNQLSQSNENDKENLHLDGQIKQHNEELLASEQKLAKALDEANREVSSLNAKHLKLTKVANGAIEKEQSFKRALDEANNEIDALKEKHTKLEDIAKEAKELEYERLRQISYLEKENLQVLGELKITKKEYQTLKARQTMVQDDNTEDFGQYMVHDALNHRENKSSHTIHDKNDGRMFSKGGSQTRRHLSNQEDNTEDLLRYIPKNTVRNALANKENDLNKTSASNIDKRNIHEQHVSLSQKRGLGSGEGESNDENTQECNNS